MSEREVRLQEEVTSCNFNLFHFFFRQSTYRIIIIILNPLNSVEATIMTASIRTYNEIDLIELLSTIIDACARGCQVIQEVNRKRQRNSNRNSASKKAFCVQYKVAGDPRSALTEADLNSQHVIMDCIQSVYGSSLNIIGEEDGDGDGDGDIDGENTTTHSCSVFEKYNVDPPSKREINKSIPNELIDEECHFHRSKLTVPSKDLTIYIDPMDGTRQFVEGRLQNVQCLIGITYKGHPIGGVIGLPFVPLETGDDSIKVVFAMNFSECNIVDTISFENGVCQSTSKNNDNDSEQKDTNIWHSLDRVYGNSDESDLKSSLKIFTGNPTYLHKRHALQHLQHFTEKNGDSLNLRVTGGCGNQILRATAYSTANSGMGNAIAIINPGACSWDTAAPSSIMFASMAKFGDNGNGNAKVTDMFGGELVYNPSGDIVENDLGALISCGEKAVEYHEKLVAAMRADKIILDSLLHKYWNNFSSDDSKNGGFRKDEEEIRLKLKNAQVNPQNVHLTRNSQGYVIKCDEIQTLVSDQMDVKGSKLIGYAMPLESNELQLFWSIGKDSRIELPDTVQLCKTNSTIKLII